VSPTSQAYCKVPPLPLADKLTVAVVFADAGLLKLTLEVVGAVTLALLTLPVTVAVYAVLLPSLSKKRRKQV
jgi:hypothetical protein